MSKPEMGSPSRRGVCGRRGPGEDEEEDAVEGKEEEDEDEVVVVVVVVVVTGKEEEEVDADARNVNEDMMGTDELEDCATVGECRE